MKITILLLSALCLALASARTIPKQGILVDFKVSSAQLNVPIQAILKVYILDAPSTLQLPLNLDEIKKYQYFEYTLPATPITANPTWDITYGFPSEYFTLSSDLVVELWSQQSASESVFVGGNQFTVAEMESHSESFNAPVLDVNGQSVGSFSMFWNNHNGKMLFK